MSTPVKPKSFEMNGNRKFRGKKVQISFVQLLLEDEEGKCYC